jgi:branched-chain amino acid transport system substrate-binding protein
MTKIQKLIALGIIAIIGVAASGCGGTKSSTAAAATPIKIGAILELTGVGSVYGLQAKDMIKMAIDQFGGKIGNHPIQVVYADDATNTANALAKARQLIERDHVDVIFGPNFSDAQDAIAPYIGSQKILDIAPIGANWTLSKYENWVVYPGTLDSFCQPAGKSLYGSAYRTMTTLGADYVAGRQLVNPIVKGFVDSGGQLVQQQWAPIGTSDFGPYISSLKKANVFAAWTIMPDELAMMQSFLKFQKGSSIHMFLCEADNVTSAQLKQLGPDIAMTTGMISSYSPVIENPANTKFITDVNRRFGRTPTIEDGGAYIMMVGLLQGLKMTGGNAKLDVLRPAILGQHMDTPAGPVSFTKNGYALSNRYIAKVVIQPNGDYNWKVVESFPNVRDPRDSG